jgi:hypothetical protein
MGAPMKSMLQSQQEIIENLKPLLPAGIQNKLHTLILAGNLISVMT